MGNITVKFITLGCKTNIYESEAMAQLFEAAGYTVVRDEDAPADVCVINTCAVTGTGAKKSRQQIRRAVRLNPGAVIAATGCFAQTEPERVRSIEGVDVIIGNKGRSEIVKMVEDALAGEKTDSVIDILREKKFEEIAVSTGQSRIRANVKIEDGCDNFCSYCIIPFARGPVRSRSLDNIIKEAEALAKNGYSEIVLTGIHIGSYGKDIKDGRRLIDVIEALDKIDGIRRIRLGSIEPGIVDEEFAARAARLDKLCPQFHLSLQSGSDATLKRMKRRYSAAQYRGAVALLRKYFKDAAITTDLMVGFVGETDEEFEESYNFCKEIGFSQMHIFKYSVRRGTAAEKMPGRVDERVKDERSHRMLSLASDMKKDFYSEHIGRVMPVLIEQERQSGVYHATTANYMDVLISCGDGKDACGRIVNARMTGYDQTEEALTAEVCETVSL